MEATMQIVASVLIALFGGAGLWSVIKNNQDIKAEKEKRAEEREAAAKIAEEAKVDRTKENKELINKLSESLLSFESNVTKQIAEVEKSVNKRIDEQEAMNKSNTEMTLCLTRDKVLFLSKKYLELGYIPDDDYETFISLGKAYIAAGGNSKVKKLFNSAKELPIK